LAGNKYNVYFLCFLKKNAKPTPITNAPETAPTSVIGTYSELGEGVDVGFGVAVSDCVVAGVGVEVGVGVGEGVEVAIGVGVGVEVGGGVGFGCCCSHVK